MINAVERQNCSASSSKLHVSSVYVVVCGAGQVETEPAVDGLQD